MLDWIRYIAGWLPAIFALSPIVLAIAWGIYDMEVHPRLVPRAEIEAMADEVMRRHPEDPEEWAFMEEE